MTDSHQAFTDAWSAHHAFLLDIAYRLLGSHGDAEDMVQEAFSRLLRADLERIEDLRAWLVVVVSRLCLDLLRSARVRRESYVGAWFPEPLIGSGGPEDPAEMVTLDESVRMAFLIVLERMSPAERVVFVLHDLFAYPFDRVAAIVGRTPAACRQLGSRARRRVREEAAAAPFSGDREEQRRVVDAFVAACATGDVTALLPLLDPSVLGWADVGGMLPAVSRPVVGARPVAEGVLRLFRPGAAMTLVPHAVNGEPGLHALRNGAVRAVIAVTVRDGRISRLYAQADPRKLPRPSAPAPPPSSG